jgi:hypothetical protein
MEDVKKELKRLAAIKCRLKKQRGKASYDVEMRKVIEEEIAVKDLREQMTNKRKSVTNYDETDVAGLSYDETVKAIKSIQSKKSLTKWLTDIEGDNDEYREACRIEQLLKQHRDILQPATKTIKESLGILIEEIEANELDVSTILNRLKELV